MDIKKIRNFCIVAHIDHGKSTLADRMLEATKTIDPREMKNQVLDSMDLERERGISIKAKAVRLEHKGFILNLIDTPGHVDFGYEVSRAMAACEGAILIIDAAQGVEAQTIANAYLAIHNDLNIIPIINKIDLPNSDIEKTKLELKSSLGINPDDCLSCSAKDGIGINEILDAIIERIPPPKGNSKEKLQALIFDSHYDNYRGVYSYIRIVNGKLKPGEQITMMSTGIKFEVEQVGVFRPDFQASKQLSAGEVGYVIAGVKEVSDAKVGDTITHSKTPSNQPLPGYKEAKPMVFCGFYPVNGEDFELLHEALEKLALNDAALFFEKETSGALGFGFRCGFLGLLHMEIIQERLEREYSIALVATSPNVIYKINKLNGESFLLDNPSQLPSPGEIESTEEPYIKLTIYSPTEYVGAIMEMTQKKRGEFKNMEYLDPTRVVITYEIPLQEIIIEFHDLLKSVTRGYASMDYEQIGYQKSDLVKMDLLLNHEPVDALSLIVPREKAYYIGKGLAEKLKKVIPRHQFDIPIQAAVGAKVIARETVRAIRKNVLAKCYGGDVTRKRKLLEKQKEGKKRMKRIGSVDVPQEAFMAVLRINE
ncbi:translation elongation factor 4 [Candidatus Margulisiibacteriota bacterium]